MDIVCKMFLSTLTARCDMGVDSNGCWMGNWCQDVAQGDSLDLNQLHLNLSLPQSL